MKIGRIVLDPATVASALGLRPGDVIQQMQMISATEIVVMVAGDLMPDVDHVEVRISGATVSQRVMQAQNVQLVIADDGAPQQIAAQAHVASYSCAPGESWPVDKLTRA